MLVILGCGPAVAISSPHYAGGGVADNDAAGVEISVAAPAGLNAALTEVARAFEEKTGHHVRLTFEDSASLYSQIRGGATFDAFFSADMQDVRRLAASRAVVASSVTEYARDQLVMCISPIVRFPFQPGNPLLALRDKTISHIAIPDPQKTASGKAAEEALKAGRDYEFGRTKEEDPDRERQLGGRAVSGAWRCGRGVAPDDRSTRLRTLWGASDSDFPAPVSAHENGRGGADSIEASFGGARVSEVRRLAGWEGHIPPGRLLISKNAT